MEDIEMLECLAKKIDNPKADYLITHFYSESNATNCLETLSTYVNKLKEIILEVLVRNGFQKLFLGKVEPFNNQNYYILYAFFDDKGKFLFFLYSNEIALKVEDIKLKNRTIFDCDFEHLKRIEKLI